MSNLVDELAKIADADNFKNGGLEHILAGELNSSGKAVGFHYEGLPGSKGKVIPGTESAQNQFGVYKAKVEVDGVAKVTNGGYSTMFPKNWTPQQVVDSINEAFSNKVLVTGNTFEGTLASGMKIRMYIDSAGKIIFAFPKL